MKRMGGKNWWPIYCYHTELWRHAEDWANQTDRTLEGIALAGQDPYSGVITSYLVTHELGDLEDGGTQRVVIHCTDYTHAEDRQTVIDFGDPVICGYYAHAAEVARRLAADECRETRCCIPDTKIRMPEDMGVYA